MAEYAIVADMALKRRQDLCRETQNLTKSRTASHGSQKRRISKDTDQERIANRTKTGYQRFESGMLDVTPRNEHERTLVVRNMQESPLLRLPRELRDTIWSYTLGGKVLVQNFHQDGLFESTTGPHDKKAIYRPAFNPFTLLSVSRQIYAETAHMPYSLNTFFVMDICDTRQWFQYFLPYQRALIQKLMLRSGGAKWQIHRDVVWINRGRTKGYFPGLKELRIVKGVSVWPRVEEGDGIRSAELETAFNGDTTKDKANDAGDGRVWDVEMAI